MKSRKQCITEPGDRRWLLATPWAAALGGLLVVLLIVAMALLHPGERAAVDTSRSTLSSASVSNLPSAPSAPSAMPATTLPPIATDAESFAAPESQPPTF